MHDGSFFLSNDLSNCLCKILAKMSALAIIIFVRMFDFWDTLETLRPKNYFLISDLVIDLNQIGYSNFRF